MRYILAVAVGIWLMLFAWAGLALTPGEEIVLQVFYTEQADALAELANPVAEFTPHDFDLMQEGKLILIPPGMNLIATAERLVKSRDVTMGGNLLHAEVWEFRLPNGQIVYGFHVSPVQGISL